jgi:hypothetical protein
MGPMSAAVIVTGFAEGQDGLFDLGRRVVRWRVGWVWYGVVTATAALAAILLITGSDVRAATLCSTPVHLRPAWRSFRTSRGASMGLLNWAIGSCAPLFQPERTYGQGSRQKAT